MFYCRNDELRKLNKRYDNGDFECVVIYGRRRVDSSARGKHYELQAISKY